MNMILSKTVESSLRKGHVYASAGDQVKVIRQGDLVAIVEDQKGERFPVNSSFLTQDYKPETFVEEKPIINRVPLKVKKSKVVPKKQNTLFL